MGGMRGGEELEMGREEEERYKSGGKGKGGKRGGPKENQTR